MGLENSSADKTKKYLYLIIGGAFLLRLVGIWYGLPGLYNSDEPFNVINALSFGAKRNLEPTYFVYPALYSYVLFAAYGGYFIVGKLLGVFGSALDFGAAYFLNPTGLFLLGRFLSVLFGTATVWLVYQMGRRYFSQRIGLLAAVILTLSFVHADLSHWILPEAAVALLAALALYLILRFFQQPGIRFNVLAGLVTGLAISTKYNAGFLILSLLAAIFFVYKESFGQMAKQTAAALVAVCGGFLIGTPYFLVSFSKYAHDLQYTFAHVGTGMVGHLRSVPLIWPFWELGFNDWTVGFLLIAGFMYALFLHDKKQIICLAFALPTFLFVGLWSRTGVHYLLPIFPALAIFAGIFLQAVWSQVKNHKLVMVLAVLLFFPPLLKIAYYDFRLTQKDTRTLAQAWIESHIPEEGVIGYENYVYGPNLFDPHRFFKNSAESRLLPAELKEILLLEKQKRISYHLINFRKEFDFQQLLDTGEQAKLQANPYLRQLLEQRLPQLATLKKAGVQYLMISSDNYERYFKSAPPVKKGPLWFNYRSGRQFYQSVLKSDDLVLLHEFQPGFWNLGPTIKIYQFKQDDENRHTKP